VALPAFAAARRAAARAAAAPAVQQSIDICQLPDPQQQTCRTQGRTEGHRTVTSTLLRILHAESANK